MAVEAETSATHRHHEKPRGCFLCPFGDHACDVSHLDGTPLRVTPGRNRHHPATLFLRVTDGSLAAVTLPEHVNPVAALLAALPGECLRTLHVRVYHLMRAATAVSEVAGEERTDSFHTTPVSALVVEPDLLLNITDINNAEYCVRQYPLRRMVPSPPTAATLRGTIIHGAFKEMLKRPSGTADVEEHLSRALQAHLGDLALRQLPYDVLRADAEPHLNALESWRAGERANLWQRTSRVRAETFLLAPEVGLKGRLDFLMQDEQGGTLLELKTGRATPHSLPKREHRWQVYGYQTLMAARRPGDTQLPGATLLYSGTPGTAQGYGIPFQPRELYHVLELRNRLAVLHATGTVPPPPGATKCARCALRTECLRASALLGWEPPESDEPRALPDPVGAAGFAHLYELLRLEAHAAEQQSRALWQLTPEQRCAAGLALGNLVLVGEPHATESGEWEYEFRCENTSELREGDAILLSDGDPVRGAVVSGSILRLTAEGVNVWTPERIANPVLIDRYESDIVHTRTVRNLWRWLDADPRLRALVAGEREPRFSVPPALDDLAGEFNAEQREAVARALAAEDFLLVQGPPGTGKTGVVAEIARRAMARGERVLVAAFTNQAVDNVLLRLLASGHSDFVRLGHEMSVAPTLHDYRLVERARMRAIAPVAASAVADNSTAEATRGEAAHAGTLAPELLRETLRAAPLVAATTATWSAERYDDAGEPLRFDLAIVDEASQLTIPALLGALRFALRFVLVGDERQLPPLVVSEEAAEQGLKRSLFADLAERWGERACVALRSQYRMHPAICAFPSREFYDGRLEAAGTARTAMLDARLDPHNPLRPVLAPQRPVVFVHVPEQSRSAEGKVSEAQALVVTKIVRALLAAEIAASDIGCIAPYRAQVAAVRQRLAGAGVADVTVDTVDRFQGGERRVIIFSFGGHARPTVTLRGSDFLADPNRLNVALTRAQRKLILTGDRDWLAATPLLARLIDYCAALYGGRGGIVNARIGAE